MDMPDDLIEKIISYLPLKFAIQYKVLNKNFNARISDPKFSQILSQRQKISTLIDSSPPLSEILRKITIDDNISASYCETSLPVDVNVLASSKGLILIDFYEIMSYCVFNPLTGAHQLIRYPNIGEAYYRGADPGFAVDYPISNQYMLVTVRELDIQEGYEFYEFSSSGVWCKFELKLNLDNDTYCYLDGIKPVYVHDSFHWLRGDGNVLAFDMKKEKGIIIDRPELIDYHCRKWLGVAHGLLTLVCTFENSIVIAAYDNASNEWSITHNMTNFIMGLDYYNYSFPVWIDREEVFYLVERPLGCYRDLYKHDSEIKRYKIRAALDKGYRMNYAFVPTLASVDQTLSHTVHPKHLSSITATLDEFKRFITDSTAGVDTEERSEVPGSSNDHTTFPDEVDRNWWTEDMIERYEASLIREGY